MRALAVLLLGALPVAAQGTLPVRVHPEIKGFQGDGRSVIATDGAASYALYSAHKEAGRAWADALFVKREGGTITYVSRAYDCAAGTWRWMGEHRDPAKISQSVASIAQIRPQRAVPGTLEHTLASYVCAL